MEWEDERTEEEERENLLVELLLCRGQRTSSVPWGVAGRGSSIVQPPRIPSLSDEAYSSRTAGLPVATATNASLRGSLSLSLYGGER